VKVAWFDAASGVSGDMILGALIDGGADLDVINKGLNSLGLKGLRVNVRESSDSGLRCVVANVEVGDKRELRHLRDIEKIIGESSLSDDVKSSALKVFGALADAEAQVHGTSRDKVHFHEVGALDTIADIVGVVIGLVNLGIKKVYASPIGVGVGFVDCEHGRFPVPAPATAELLKGWPVRFTEADGEITTPTGAAILTTLGTPGAGIAQFRPTSIGMATGTRKFTNHQTFFRVMLGEQDDLATGDEVVELAATIDDATPELLGALYEFLPEAGALDVVIAPVVMKKCRPAHEVRALAPVEKREAVINAIFKHSSTFGIRIYPVARRKLERKFISVDTCFGPVAIKIGMLDGRAVTVKPEYDDCLTLARKAGVSVAEVMREAAKSYERYVDEQ